MRKIVRKDNSQIKKILSIGLVLFLFMGIGYSVISTNLMFNGNIELSKYESPYLYDVLKFEALRGGLARKYTGEHHDSFTEEPSKDIYHWYADNDAEGPQVLNKNNVVFAGQCWQMLRTTDTGGVKMIYNGEAENNQCLNSREKHIGYDSPTTLSLNSNYWYGTDYIYDSTNKVFKISGTIEQVIWNATTGPTLIGKYTCKSTTETGTCSTLYLIESYSNASVANVLSLNSNSDYSQFGTLKFNKNYNSPTYVGYMYGDVYSSENINSTSVQNFTSTETLLSSISFGTSYWYASSIEYGSSSAYNYSLVDPYQVSEITDYPNLVGKYTFGSDNQTFTNTSVCYIAGVNDTKLYCKVLRSGNLLTTYEPILFGETLTNNGDGTYTINNTTSVTLSEWYTNYASYKNKYTCNTSSNTCSNPRYLTASTATNYSYIEASEKIMIGKNRSGTTLTDTILLYKDEFVINRSSYSEYKYTCNSDNAVCTDATLRMITAYTETGYTYVPNRYYGSSVTWDGTNYTLVDPIEIENYNNLNNLSTHHYICVSPGLKNCTTVGYLYYYTGTGMMYYISLKDGVTTVSKVMEDMFTKNTTNSTIKNGIDAWYKKYILEYDNYIEDTIFCNDRSVRSLGGWDDNGGMTNTYLLFNEYSATSDISCINNTDSFSVSNNDALLNYKVGLMSSPEMKIINNRYALKSEQAYWLASPLQFTESGGNSFVSQIGFYGILSIVSVNYNFDAVRPAISLKPGTEYIYGTGTMEDPYVIKTKRECTYNGELTQGAEFTDGQYTYRYKQSFGNSNWWNIDDDGWGVTLTDKNSTDLVNTKLCTSINNKPIVSMTGMFENSQATSIDTSSFDTSNVTSMWKMFAGSQATTLDLRSFDTSKVTSMGSMFSGSQATSIDVSSFDTKNVENMDSMFYSSNATVLNLGNFDTKNVFLMNSMFSHSQATSIDVSSFNTKNVENMNSMFNNSKVTSLDISSFDNSNVFDDFGMFCNVNRDIITSGSKFTFNDEMFGCPS